VHPVWHRHDVQPHRLERFKVSRIHGSKKSADIVGLYLNSPDRALVLCLDGKSQIQALDRTASGIFRAALLQILLCYPVL
jgi:hypothetical protein